MQKWLTQILWRFAVQLDLCIQLFQPIQIYFRLEIEKEQILDPRVFAQFGLQAFEMRLRLVAAQLQLPEKLLLRVYYNRAQVLGKFVAY